MTARESDGRVAWTQTYSYGNPQRLIAGDTRCFQISLPDRDLAPILAGRYEVDLTWSETPRKVNNVSLW
ncbi:MAG: hypothetical protein AB1505_20000 [Candidatus Latescibacterota bacterium]